MALFVGPWFLALPVHCSGTVWMTSRWFKLSLLLISLLLSRYYYYYYYHYHYYHHHHLFAVAGSTLCWGTDSSHIKTVLFLWNSTATSLDDVPHVSKQLNGVIFKGINNHWRIFILSSLFFGDEFWNLIPMRSLETSGTNHPATRLHITEDWKTQIHQCEGLKTRLR